MKATLARLDIEDWLILIGFITGAVGFYLLGGPALGCIFLSAGTLGLFLVNVWRAGR